MFEIFLIDFCLALTALGFLFLFLFIINKLDNKKDLTTKLWEQEQWKTRIKKHFKELP